MAYPEPSSVFYRVRAGPDPIGAISQPFFPRPPTRVPPPNRALVRILVESGGKGTPVLPVLRLFCRGKAHPWPVGLPGTILRSRRIPQGEGVSLDCATYPSHTSVFLYEGDVHSLSRAHGAPESSRYFGASPQLPCAPI